MLAPDLSKQHFLPTRVAFASVRSMFRSIFSDLGVSPVNNSSVSIISRMNGRQISIVNSAVDGNLVFVDSVFQENPVCKCYCSEVSSHFSPF